VCTNRSLRDYNPGMPASSQRAPTFRNVAGGGSRDRQSNRPISQQLDHAEHKDVDRFRGEPAEGTGVTSVFIGPRLVASRGRFSAEVAVDLPMNIDNTALQAVSDYRLRGAISFHF
jgi:hypothetical protein